MIALIVLLMIILVIVLIVASAVFSAKKRFGSSVSEILNTIKQADAEQMSTPKSLSGTEPVWRDKIAADFPELDLTLAKGYIKGFLPEYFSALSKGDVSGIRDNCTSQLCESLKASLDGQRLEGKTLEQCSNVLVHKVVVSGYTRSNEDAQITFEAAVQYMLSGRLSQHKYKIMYSYFLEYGSKGENASLKCQNCGAPISTIGEKVCPYCGEAIEASVERTWKVSEIVKIN